MNLFLLRGWFSFIWISNPSISFFDNNIRLILIDFTHIFCADFGIRWNLFDVLLLRIPDVWLFVFHLTIIWRLFILTNFDFGGIVFYLLLLWTLIGGKPRGRTFGLALFKVLAYSQVVVWILLFLSRRLLFFGSVFLVSDYRTSRIADLRVLIRLNLNNLPVWANFPKDFPVFVNYFSIRVDLSQNISAQPNCLSVLEFSNNSGDVLDADDVVIGEKLANNLVVLINGLSNFVQLANWEAI